MVWWIDETPYPGPVEELIRVVKPGEVFKHPDTGQVMGIVMRADVSLHPPASGQNFKQVRFAYNVMVSNSPETYQEYTVYYPEWEVDLEN